MEKLRATIEYWTQAARLLEAQFFILVEKFYNYFFDQVDNE